MESSLWISAAAWIASRIPWNDILCNVRSRMSVSLCKTLRRMVDDDIYDDGWEMILEESELYELFQLLVGNNFVDTGYHYGHYIVFLDWVRQSKGESVARRVDKKLRKEVPHHLPSILYLISAKVRAACRCGGRNRTASE